MTTYQHGDVILKKINELPDDLKVKTTNVLAEGEHTGHYHSLCPKGTQLARYKEIPGLTFYSDKNGNSYVKIDTELDLLHQEHAKIEVPPAIYKVEIVREYDHFAQEARNVED